MEKSMRNGLSYPRSRSLLLALFLSFLVPLPALAQGETEVRQGVIEQITETQLQTNHHRGLGAIVGGLGGYDQPTAGQQIIVRVRSGVLVQITQPANPNLRPGQQVYIEGSGEDARVVPRT